MFGFGTLSAALLRETWFALALVYASAWSWISSDFSRVTKKNNSQTEGVRMIGVKSMKVLASFAYKNTIFGNININKLKR